MGDMLLENDDIALRSMRFRKEREAQWKSLHELIDQAERKGIHSFSYEQANELSKNYRMALNSLSIARSTIMDKALLQYLERLCSRAYLVVHAPPKSLAGIIWKQLVFGLPQAARDNWKYLLFGFFSMLLGVWIGFGLFAQDESWFFTFVGSSLSDGRAPGASQEYLRSTIYDGGDYGHQEAGGFSSFLFSHNARIAIFIFGMGVFAVVPSYLLTFYNGVVLGCFYALFHTNGLGFDIFAWLSIHGVIEISAICVACAGGSILGFAILAPGPKTRKAALQSRGKDATKLAIMAILMLILAAFIEGYLRQWVQDPYWRLGVGWSIGALWLMWIVFSGRNRGTGNEHNI